MLVGKNAFTFSFISGLPGVLNLPTKWNIEIMSMIYHGAPKFPFYEHMAILFLQPLVFQLSQDIVNPNAQQ